MPPRAAHSPARYSSTISQYLCGACSNIGWVVPGIISVRDPEGDVAAARMAHQIDRFGVELFDKANHVVDMLGDRIGVADTIPTIGEEMPQTDRDHTTLARQRTQHRRPDAEIAQRAVYA